MRYLLSTALATVIASQLYAADTVFLIANEDYANGRDISAASEMLDAENPLKNAGFVVSSIKNATLDVLNQELAAFAQTVDGTGRIVIAATAHFAKSGHDAWLLATDADEPALGNAGGVSLRTFLEIAGRAPGQSVVLLGTEVRRFDFGAGLQQGIGLYDIPQGVTVITGPADDISDFTKDILPSAGQSLVTALLDWPSLTGHGFLAPLVPFLTKSDGVESTPPDPNASEHAFWAASQSTGTVNAYRGYLTRYDKGLFADQARAAIARIKAEPALRAQADETALNLSRDVRRQIQRDLSLIGFNPRGIDGIFGRGSRAAISAFQTANSQDATGFVTQPQIKALSTQAETTALELERKARARERELDRKDREYWNATGTEGDESGLRTYLERYPDGVFSAIATKRLEPYEATRRAQAQAVDRSAWDLAQVEGSVEGYSTYLRANPSGAFVDQARKRIALLQQDEQNAGALAVAQRNEAQLGMNGATRKLVEDRLTKAGLNPGPIDGQFDSDTRRAIRRYQEARNINNTGYLNQETVVRLLAEAVFR